MINGNVENVNYKLGQGLIKLHSVCPLLQVSLFGSLLFVCKFGKTGSARLDGKETRSERLADIAFKMKDQNLCSHVILEDPSIFQFLVTCLSLAFLAKWRTFFLGLATNLQLETFPERDFIQNYIFQRAEKTTFD